MQPGKVWGSSRPQLPKLYLIEQSFIEQVQFLQSNQDEEDD
jgi:hypothetical protein